MRRIYLASSWRNAHQPAVLAALRSAGHEVYDFRHPTEGGLGFGWGEIDPDWQRWSTEQYVAALQHPIAQRGFDNDFSAMRRSDTCVLLLPCGRSAHIEAGWMAGAGREVFVLQLEPQEPELMYLCCHGIAGSVDDLLLMLAGVRP